MNNELEKLIVGKVSLVSGYTEEELSGKRGKRELTDAKGVLRYLLHINGFSKSHIAEKYGINHASVINSLNNVAGLMQTNRKFREWVELKYSEFLINRDRKPVYIIGRVTGEPYDYCFRKFAAREAQLVSAGFTPVNPMRIVPKDTPWPDAMKICIGALVQCWAVSPIPGWEQSEGALLEMTVANKLLMGQIH